MNQVFHANQSFAPESRGPFDETFVEVEVEAPPREPNREPRPEPETLPPPSVILKCLEEILWAHNLAGSLEAASRSEHKKCDSTAIVYSMKVRIYIYA